MTRILRTSSGCPMDSRFHLLLLAILMAVSTTGFAQLEATISTIQNTNCEGSECDYDGPGILINEIMMSPTSFDGSLWGGSATNSGEWIELYNPDFCNDVDISCYYLGNSATDVGVLRPGGYVIPQGTVVPPAGFVIIRGINAAPVPANLLLENGGNTIELVVESNANLDGQVCTGGGARLWFPNAGGWFAFYDSFGEPQDAIRWANAPAADLAGEPCIPPFPSCGSAQNLVSYNDFPEDRKENIYSGNSAADFQGQSFRRIPDGGMWSGAAPATYGTCNDECVDLGTSTCNGVAIVSVSGAVGDYTAVWDDAQIQVGDTAVGLCAQEYCVTISDEEGNEVTECVTIEEPFFETSDEASFCEGETFTLPDGSVVDAPGEYESNLLTAGGCDSLVLLSLEMFPSYSFELNPEICENSSYTLPDGEEVSEEGTYLLEYQTANGCDSIYTVNLDVTPVISVSQNATICGGEVYSLPDGTQVTEAGEYTVQVAGAECDTVFEVLLAVDPSYDLEILAEICADENYTLPGGEVVSESGIYTIELVTETGCDSIIETQLTVNPLPVLNIPLPAEFCFQPGTIDVNPTPPGGTLTGVLVEDNTLELDLAPAGDYTVFYSYTDPSGCSGETQHDYTVLPPVEPLFEARSGCFNVAEFTNLTVGDDSDIEYVWSIDTTVFSNAFEPQYSYNNPGTFTVQLTAINGSNCAYSYSAEVVFEESLQAADYWIPNIISPNGDDVNQQLRLMPLEDQCLDYQIKIFNRWGKQVYEMSEGAPPFEGQNESGVDLEEGTYFYLFESPQVDCSNAAFENLCNGSVTVVR